MNWIFIQEMDVIYKHTYHVEGSSWSWS